MTKRIGILFAAILGLSAVPVLAAEQRPASTPPDKLSDTQLDDVKGGDPLIYVGVLAPISVNIAPITVSVPVNVAAIIQANVLGNGVFSGTAVGTQNNYGVSFTPGG